LGESAEMILSQKSSTRPDSYGSAVEQPFRPNALKTGVLVDGTRPEYREINTAKQKD